MAYVGNIRDKITAEITIVGYYEFTSYSFSYYGNLTRIYKMKDEDGNILVWKTGSCMSVVVGVDKYGNDIFHVAGKGDKLEITGTVKDHSVYKDEEQTVLTRVKFKFIEKTVTFDEKVQLTQKEQLDTLNEGDFVWEMPYKQFKEHYSDCETLYHSYDDHAEECRHTNEHIPATIVVIIREGRLKKSGVRGEHFSGYEFENELGKKVTYRAVNEDNALRRCKKDFPENEWKCVKIYRY